MTAPQDLVAVAARLGMGKVSQEALAAFAREVLAEQAAEVERLQGDVQRLTDERDAAERAAGDADHETERLRARLDSVQQEASANLERVRMRARNEGLEQAAVVLPSLSPLPRERLPDAIRAMKEAEQ